MFTWGLEPSVLLGSLLLAASYLACIGPRRITFRGAAPVSAWRVASFLLGVAMILLALATPLDELSDRYLLSAHMVQHSLLTLFMPPLLLLGTPGWLLRPLLRSWLVAALARVVTRPLVAFLVFNLTLALSHFPVIYDFTLRDHNAHIALHLAYMVSGVITWWPLFGSLPELPRLAYPLQMLYVFAQTLPGGLVGAMISMSGDVLYPTYAAAPRVTALSAIQDQQLGGLIMWVGTWTVLFAMLTVIFFIWASREQAGERVAPTHAA